MIGLFLTLSGAMRSWGSTSIGDDRWTDQFPTASAILGLAGACMGVDYNNAQQTKAWYNAFLVCTISAISYRAQNHSKPTHYPSIFSDYQTTKNSLAMNNTRKPETIVSNRGHIANGLDVAAIIPIHNEAEGWLQQLSFAIQQPYFTPYLGRRANPLAAPLAEPGEKIIHTKDIEALLDLLFDRLSHQKIGNKIPADCLLRIPQILQDETDSFKQKWTFSGRTTIADHRVSLPRFFENRDVISYRRTMEVN